MSRSAHGFTLIELVLAIVIIGIAVTGILTVMNETTAHSADPMIEHQEIAIAQAYLEEILTKSYTNNGVAGETRSGPPCVDTYDDVMDYNGLVDDPVRDQSGCTVATLAAYKAQVTVDPTATLGGLANVEEITVTVTNKSNGSTVSLTGYRTNY